MYLYAIAIHACNDIILILWVRMYVDLWHNKTGRSTCACVWIYIHTYTCTCAHSRTFLISSQPQDSTYPIYIHVHTFTLCAECPICRTPYNSICLASTSGDAQADHVDATADKLQNFHATIQYAGTDATQSMPCSTDAHCSSNDITYSTNARGGHVTQEAEQHVIGVHVDVDGDATAAATEASWHMNTFNIVPGSTEPGLREQDRNNLSSLSHAHAHTFATTIPGSSVPEGGNHAESAYQSGRVNTLRSDFVIMAHNSLVNDASSVRSPCQPVQQQHPRDDSQVPRNDSGANLAPIPAAALLLSASTLL